MILKIISLTILILLIGLLLTTVINMEVTDNKTGKTTNLNGITILILTVICFLIINL